MRRQSVLCLIMLFVLLTGCGASATPTSAPTVAAPAATSTKSAATAPATAVSATATAPAPAATAAPAVGGTLVCATTSDIDSLDEAGSGNGFTILSMLGGTLISRNPKGEFVPFLAESWSLSSDGLAYDFKLRKDIRFSDGTPCTAQDYVWTIQRYLDPASKVWWLSSCLPGVTGAEAVDDTTLRLELAAPQYYLLSGLSIPGFVQPQSKAAVTKYGTDYAFHPLGVGPFKLKSWQTGEKIVLERNADFKWGPAYTHGGPAYIETVEFRILTEEATIVAGLEALELDYAMLTETNLDRIESTGKFSIVKTLQPGIPMSLLMNVSRAPFDDLKVRQAFSYALDRDTMVKVLGQGSSPANTPLTPATPGYWAGSTKLGYVYDLAKAKALMKEAGYAPGADGMLQKDGKPLVLSLLIHPLFQQASLVAQEQLKALGVKVDLRQEDMGVLVDALRTGNFDLFVVTVIMPDAQALPAFFDSSQIDGGLNYGRVNDPALDENLRTMMSAASAEVNQQASDEAQRRIQEQVYIVPLCGTIMLGAMNKRVDGVTYGQEGYIGLYDANIKSSK